MNKLLASDDDDKDDAFSKLFGAGDLAGLEAELSKQARELADLLKPTKTKKNSGFRTVEISPEDLAKLFPSANDQKVRVELGDGQVFTVDFDGDIQRSILQKSKKNPVPTVAAFLESVSGRQTDNFDFPCSTEPCAGCVSWAADPAILMDGTRAGPARARCVHIYRETSRYPSSRSQVARRTGSSRTSVVPKRPRTTSTTCGPSRPALPRNRPRSDPRGVLWIARRPSRAELSEEEADHSVRLAGRRPLSAGAAAGRGGGTQMLC